jgi:hypothetical protein
MKLKTAFAAAIVSASFVVGAHALETTGTDRSSPSSKTTESQEKKVEMAPMRGRGYQLLGALALAVGTGTLMGAGASAFLGKPANNKKGPKGPSA